MSDPPDVLESGPQRDRTRLLRVRRTPDRRHRSRWRLLVLLVVVAALAAGATAARSRQRTLAAKDVVRLAVNASPGITGVAVDMATRSVVFDIGVENVGRYPVVVTGVWLGATPLRLTVLRIAATNPQAVAHRPKVDDGVYIRLVPYDEVDAEFVLKPACSSAPAAPHEPPVVVRVRSARGRVHTVTVGPAASLARLWTGSIRSACVGKVQ